MPHQLHILRLTAFTLLSIGWLSCCIGNRKCNQDDNTARIRILSVNGTDLVFGPGRTYHKDSIRLYSLSGTDTVFHSYGAGPNPTPGGDSILYVSFDRRKFQLAYIRLNSSDTDTLQIGYTTIDASPCCPDYITVQPVSVNNNSIATEPGGISIIRK